MIISLVRCRESEFGTFGRLYLDDIPQCYTLEPTSIGLHPCIPIGEYTITLDVVSPKYRYRFPYNTLCKGKVPRVLDVPKRSGILIHIGNFLKDTSGCILVGEKTSLTRLYNSTNAFIALYKKLRSASDLILKVSYVY